MKKTFLALMIVCLGIKVFSQETRYLVKTDLPYYADSASSTNEYLKKRCVLDIYYPEMSKGFATIVWFHGGGLTAGSKEIPEALKQKNVCVVSVNYRLSPQVNSPKYIEDAAAAVAWVFKNIGKFGGDSSLIFISGHSAGGYLATMIGLDKKWLKAYNVDANKIAGLIPLSGQMITHFIIRKERGIAETVPIIDNLAPLFHVNANAAPLLLITGDRELELYGRYEENAYMMRMMKVAGHKQTKLIELQGYGHNMAAPAYPLLINEVRRIVDEKRNHQALNKNTPENH